MAWFWTDDLAHALVEAGIANEVEVRPWVDRPTAVAAGPGLDPVTVGRSLLGGDTQAAGAA